MKDFEPTHRYKGGDENCFFTPGTLVSYIGEYDSSPDDEYNATIGVYTTKVGTVQYVLRDCIEEI